MMADYITEFCEWFSEWWENLLVNIWWSIKIILACGLVITSIPLWGLPFLYWLIFVKGREEDAD